MMSNEVGKTYTIEELIEKCSSKRIENTPEYRKSVRESNEQIKYLHEYFGNQEICFFVGAGFEKTCQII